MSYPNELFTAFSFIGFILCAIPFYWHFKAWNTGTCLYMIWAGLGCLLLSINSIVWNKNMINRVPVYCDIVTRIQVAQNVAIPACSLCINRHLYKVATAKVMMPTDVEKRRAVIQDLLIGVGLPILQIIAQYVVSPNRYDIVEDVGPVFGIVVTPLAFILFYAWPVAIGTISLFYCIITIRAFYKRQRQFKQMMSHSQGASRGLYLRLMALSATEILGTIPLGTYIIVVSAKAGVRPWKGWAYTHSNYSAVAQIAGIIWRNDHNLNNGLEMFRWSLVACAFVFFAFFGFTDETRQLYRRVYTPISSRIGVPRFIFHGPVYLTSMIFHVKSNATATEVTTSGEKRRSSVSFADRFSIGSTTIIGDIKPNFKVKLYSPSNSMASFSVESLDGLKMKELPALPAGIMPTVPPAYVPRYFPDRTKSTLRAYSGVDAV